jgi:hypothetical protein
MQSASCCIVIFLRYGLAQKNFEIGVPANIRSSDLREIMYST